jgi:hypothetical protein
MRGWKWPCQTFYNIFSEHYPSFHCVSHDKETKSHCHCQFICGGLFKVSRLSSYFPTLILSWSC